MLATWNSSAWKQQTQSDTPTSVPCTCLYPFVIRYQRINAIGAACTYGVPGCAENATNEFNGWMENPTINT